MQRLVCLPRSSANQALEICGRKADCIDGIKATSLETLRRMAGLGGGCTLLPALAVDGAPGSHPRHVDRALEVVAVLRLGEPAALTRRLACLAAHRLRAVPLMSAVAWISSKQLPTTQALASSRALHRSASPCGGSCGSTTEHERRYGRAGKNTQNPAKKISEIENIKENRRRKYTTFIPAKSHDYQNVGDRVQWSPART